MLLLLKKSNYSYFMRKPSIIIICSVFDVELCQDRIRHYCNYPNGLYRTSSLGKNVNGISNIICQKLISVSIMVT